MFPTGSHGRVSREYALMERDHAYRRDRTQVVPLEHTVARYVARHGTLKGARVFWIMYGQWMRGR